MSGAKSVSRHENPSGYVGSFAQQDALKQFYGSYKTNLWFYNNNKNNQTSETKKNLGLKFL